jgi:hypothetical protein
VVADKADSLNHESKELLQEVLIHREVRVCDIDHSRWIEEFLGSLIWRGFRKIGSQKKGGE